MTGRGRTSVGLLAAFLAALALLPASAGAVTMPLAQVSGEGSLAGQLLAPRGIAVDGLGNLFVADTDNHRIAAFTASGQFIAAVGHDVIQDGGTGLEVCTAAMTCKAGTAGGDAGELNMPYRIALGPDGNIYVADKGNHRISVFNLAGGFVRAFGHDVDPAGLTGLETCTATCKPGDDGDDAGQLDDPRGVEVSPGGNVFVADTENHRVSVFTLTGGFIRAFGHDVDPIVPSTGLETCTLVCKIGTTGTDDGELDNPFGIGLDSTGRVYVSENGNDRVTVFTAMGGFDRKFGTLGVDDGELTNPSGIVADGSGNSHVAEAGNNRISAFTANGTFTRNFGFDVLTGGVTTYELCLPGQTCKAGTTGTAAGQLDGPEDVALDCRGAIWSADTGNGRLQRFGEPGTPLCGAAGPAGGAQAANRNIIIGTPGNDRLTGTAGADLIICGAGNDVVNAGAGNDIIDCGDGNDRVNAGAGDDLVLGGRGNDRLVGVSGNDRLNGQAGNDRAGGGSGLDNITGAAGRDRLSGNSGRDRLSGNSGNDRVSGGSGNDRLGGGSGNDRLGGGSGNDRLGGGSGNDRLSGNSGRDRLSGNSGNDRLRGNAGIDRLNGGSGRDSLRGGAGLDILVGGPGRDSTRQ